MLCRQDDEYEDEEQQYYEEEGYEGDEDYYGDEGQEFEEEYEEGIYEEGEFEEGEFDEGGYEGEHFGLEDSEFMYEEQEVEEEDFEGEDLEDEVDFQLDPDARLEDYLYDEEIQAMAVLPEEGVPFREGELQLMMFESPPEEESSFNDDGVPPSEDDFFSSEFVESDVGDYVPPLTNTKKALIFRLMKLQINEDDEDADEKQAERDRILKEFQEYFLKKRAAKAYRRYKKVEEMEMEDPTQEAFILEKMEIADKKLHRSFYYEEFEPWTYKRLLRKRRRAIRRKYERYSLDPDYREEIKEVILRNVGKFLVPELEKPPPPIPVLLGDSDLDDDDEETYVTEDEEEAGGDEAADEEEADAEGEPVPEDDAVSVSEGSSFYDDDIPNSELEYFSSDYEEDCDIYYPGARSRTLDRYRGLLAKCRSQFFDDEATKVEKLIKAAEVEVQFQTFLERKRAYKALSRLKVVEDMKLTDPAEEAEQFLHLEIVDKKLHRAYYYGEDEPQTYKILLGKRRRALIRKYERFARDERFRDQVKRNIYTQVLRVQPSPMFDADFTDDGESSFNDSEVPSSEEQFMSPGEIEVPRAYEKPVTRRKQELYDLLEQYEPDGLNDDDDMIMEKRARRLEIIQRFKDTQAKNRLEKAQRRLDEVRNMGINDPFILANELKDREIADKKLNRGFYYSPGEPDVFKLLLEKRIRAIMRKCKKYATDKKFREELHSRLAKPQTKKIEAIYDKEVTWQSFGDPYDFGEQSLVRFLVIS
ncbi:probable serine/threonine-protein kinase kinX [Hermetia illucens]|uniref:probable serine/threonine-protein kinase kinX n=1 Tax=Hermetia illucens TaxID=343691 RepID=UPI0018CC64E0|nr:probable serine/threonine-protein kinase kinX [Hermetia illucens]